MRYSVYAAVLIVATHERRHLWQASVGLALKPELTQESSLFPRLTKWEEPEVRRFIASWKEISRSVFVPPCAHS